MTREGSRDFLVAAVVVSLLAHFALMFWAKPRVMTHVVSSAVRLMRRGPMRMTDPAARPDPVSLSVVQDESPTREAPVADAEGVSLPHPSAALASPEIAEAEAEAPRFSEGIDMPSPLTPEAEVPEMSVVTSSRPDEPEPTFEPVEFDRVTVPVSVESPAARQTVELPVSVPIFALPAPTPELPISAAQELERLPPTVALADEGNLPEFVPVAEVMEEVDATVVEEEKSAVRRLLLSGDAGNLTKAVDVALTSAAAGGYVYFRVRVTPRAELKPVPKDVVILLDASGSIGSDRLTSCRKAARRILRTCTNTGDRFNLVAFRDRFAYAFRTWRACDAESFEAGDRWLGRLAAHGRTDVFSTIASVLTLPRDPKRPLVALVVTDGDANSGVQDTREILSRFTRLNDGLISVYMYGVKSSANRELIDILTRGNRGESFVFDGWRWSAGEGIDSLSERFRDPVLADLRVIFSAGCEAEVYPSLLKNLYRGNSVEIVGRMRGEPRDVSFSLTGLAGARAYEGFFRLPLAGSTFEANLPTVWADEVKVDRLIGR